MLDKEAIQKYCEQIEELVDRDCVEQRLNMKDFNILNALLLELQAGGLYKIPEKFYGGIQ